MKKNAPASSRPKKQKPSQGPDLEYPLDFDRAMKAILRAPPQKKRTAQLGKTGQANAPGADREGPPAPVAPGDPARSP